MMLSLGLTRSFVSKFASPASIARRSMSMEVKRMEVPQFGKILKDESTRSLYQIIDVREVNELDVAAIPGADIINLPLSTSNDWAPKIGSGELLDKSKPTLCLCHHGMRSMNMANFLTSQAGFEEVYNVEGGIDQFSVKVDSSITRY